MPWRYVLGFFRTFIVIALYGHACFIFWSLAHGEQVRLKRDVFGRNNSCIMPPSSDKHKAYIPYFKANYIKIFSEKLCLFVFFRLSGLNSFAKVNFHSASPRWTATRGNKVFPSDSLKLVRLQVKSTDFSSSAIFNVKKILENKEISKIYQVFASVLALRSVMCKPTVTSEIRVHFHSFHLGTQLFQKRLREAIGYLRSFSCFTLLKAQKGKFLRIEIFYLTFKQFPEDFRRFLKIRSLTILSFSEDYRRCPKISDEDPKMFRLQTNTFSSFDISWEQTW